jgi:hypothetical protein
MPTNSREKSVRAARKKISDERLIACLRAAREESQGVFAVELACDNLDKCKSLDELFYTGDIYGYSLRVQPRGEDKYKIEFSCQAGPTAGDGGEWDVVFDGDTVASITGGLNFIS